MSRNSVPQRSVQKTTQDVREKEKVCTVPVGGVSLCLIAAWGGGDAATTTTVGGVTTPVTNASVSTTARSTGPVTLEVPAEVGAGTDFPVEWTGPNNGGDYVALASVRANEGTYQSYFLTQFGTPSTLLAPVTAGEYEVRYVDGESDATIHSVTVIVLPFVVELTPPETVEGGTEFEVAWSVLMDQATTSPSSQWDPLKASSSPTFEIRYVSERVPDLIFGTIPLSVG